MNEVILKKLLRIAKQELSKTETEYRFSSIFDLGDSYLVNWDSGEEHKYISDNLSIEIEKGTWRASVFFLPDIENFEKLDKAIVIWENREGNTNV